MSNVPRNTSSTDPKLLKARVFIGNLPTEKVTREDLTETFGKYGDVIGCSVLRGYGFVQYLKEDDARKAVSGESGRMMHGATMDVRMAAEGRRNVQDSSREDGGGWGNEPQRRKRPRSRSPHRPEWDYPPPPHDHYPPPPHRYHDYYEGQPPPPQPRRYSPPPPPHYHGDYGGPPPPQHPARPPPLHEWERDQREQREPQQQPPPPRNRPPPPAQRQPSPRPQWYRKRSPSPRQQGLPQSENKVDMEIIVINKQQMEYANVVSRRVSELGLKVSLKVLSPTASLSELLDKVAKQGLLYAMIITNQHEVHRSLTLTILYGRTPQEHKNMPLEDALGLINRDFSHYCQAVREGRFRQQQQKSGGNSDFTIEQLTTVIDNLQQKKNELIQKQVPPLMGSGTSIQQQQADLQAKILSLLGSNAVVPSTQRPAQQSQPHNYWGGSY